MKFISICFICLQRGRDRNGHGRRAAGLQEAATPGRGPRGRPKPHRLSGGCDCLSWGSTGRTAPWWRRSRRKRRRKRRSLQQKPEVWRRAHRGEVPGGGGQRGEAAARRHNIQIMVSPQHPCEVGWKVATIVMPTSQTRPGHRGKHTRDGLARQGGPSPLSGFPSSQQSQGRLQHTVTWTWGIKMVALKKKNKKRTKPKIVMLRRGEKNRHFLPKWPDFKRAGSATGVAPSTVPTSCPHPGHPSSSEFHLCGWCPQHPTTTSHQQWLPEEPLPRASAPIERFPAAGLWGSGRLWPHAQGWHQGHTPQGKGFPALPTKAGWTVAGGWKEKGGGGGWQFPLACCCPCWVGGGCGPPGPGVCP